MGCLCLLTTKRSLSVHLMFDLCGQVVLFFSVSVALLRWISPALQWVKVAQGSCSEAADVLMIWREIKCSLSVSRVRMCLHPCVRDACLSSFSYKIQASEPCRGIFESASGDFQLSHRLHSSVVDKSSAPKSFWLTVRMFVSRPDL